MSMKDIISLTIRLTEKDPVRLHSRQNLERLQLCAQALEIGTDLCIVLEGLDGLEHKIIIDESRMQVSLLYSQPAIGARAEKKKSPGNLYILAGKLHSSFEQSKQELAKEGLEVETKITDIETLPIPK